MPELSVIIPARNEIFLSKTIENILENIEGDTEIIAVCDGYWPDPVVKDHPKVTLIHHTVPVGQRAAVNEGARLSKAKFIMKLDAHSAVDKGFDVKLMQDCEKDWTVIPRMFNLHGFDWQCKTCGNRSYQDAKPSKCFKKECSGKDFEMVIVWQPRLHRRTDFARFDKTLHFQYWSKYEKRKESQGDIADVMSSVGACFFMHRDRFFELEGMDEEHGSWGQFGTEVSCKSWLSGGRQVVNKKAWFAHMFRTHQGFSFPYHITNGEQERARQYSRDLWFNNKWPKAKHKLDYIINKFAPIPDWH